MGGAQKRGAKWRNNSIRLGSSRHSLSNSDGLGEAFFVHWHTRLGHGRRRIMRKRAIPSKTGDSLGVKAAWGLPDEEAHNPPTEQNSVSAGHPLLGKGKAACTLQIVHSAPTPKDQPGVKHFHHSASCAQHQKTKRIKNSSALGLCGPMLDLQD
jgi:hypothetical protein